MKNRSERNSQFETQASSIFKDKKLVVERPSDMDFDSYKFLRRLQRNLLKQLFHKGKSPNRKLVGLMGNRR